MNSAASDKLNFASSSGPETAGSFVDFLGERYYKIENVDGMAPFFVSVISDGDHWLFVSSTGGLTAGRVSPETALFPYVTVDKIHDGYLHTGPRTVVRLDRDGQRASWEPFNRELDGDYAVTRNLYKNLIGNKLCFEEINHDLGMTFRYSWLTSDEFGFVRRCEMSNNGESSCSVSLLDGLQNLLPAGTPRFTQTNSSNLVDAYKWTELDEQTGLAYFALYSGISDRAEPCESMKATTLFALGLGDRQTLVSSNQLATFRLGGDVTTEKHTRGIRGSYFVQSDFEIAGGSAQTWSMVANLEQTQSEVVALRRRLRQSDELATRIADSIDKGSDALARIMASSDGFQATAEENVSGHHYANVMFNVLRGGIFDDQYFISAKDFSRTVRHFNSTVADATASLLDSLPDRLRLDELLAKVNDSGDRQLQRLALEYLPITFGRRHGDPSRPWNQFAIRLTDEHGDRLLSYEGNWRDIFQNWEALSYSYPSFLPSIIAKFVNASTADGYNPYRITKEGIDWEVEEPDDPWSYIGYWGDHQIIYLQKLLELSEACYPAKLKELLHEDLFAYANVPYRIRPFADLVANPKDTVLFDDPLAERIEERLSAFGADGKLMLDSDGNVYQVNLVEKLLVPLLAKLGNMVVDGGIWMNTQRPEWNDANNALVGYGLSMVTLYYMRRYVVFLKALLDDADDNVKLSAEVNEWLGDTASSLDIVAGLIAKGEIDERARADSLNRLGNAADRYRALVYENEGFGARRDATVASIQKMLDSALIAIDHSIGNNRREDGLYEAYNLIVSSEDGVAIDKLYLMLEGQVGALSSGAVGAAEAANILEKMFSSSLYRDDQQSFMLYPDRELPGFLERNRVDESALMAIPLIEAMLGKNDYQIIERDADSMLRFNADFVNGSDLKERLQQLTADYGDLVDGAGDTLLSLYEETFNHRAFTGRSGTMFGFEGLGSIYWHMVSKLLLAAMEVFYAGVDAGEDRAALTKLGEMYYRVRHGIGFNKTPSEYGAFPLDPYSHSPRHAGARQPGMTGQVKEEILSRFGELGVRIANGCARFEPALLRRREFVAAASTLRYLDVGLDWRELDVVRGSLAFTWCQVPVVYSLNDSPSLSVEMADGSVKAIDGLKLDADLTHEIIERTGSVVAIRAGIPDALLLGD
ncbi:MAG: hypothetical protein AAGF72_15140 [Pseudomonadota bacterium]